MNVCFPVQTSDGFESEVYGHFGSAPMFVVVDTLDRSIRTIENFDMNHTKGMCSPLRALGGVNIDGIVVGGIGRGALKKLNILGITVYRATARNVRGNLEILDAGRLPVFKSDEVCSGHRDGCAH